MSLRSKLRSKFGRARRRRKAEEQGPPKPAGRESWKKTFEVCEKARDEQGVYPSSAVKEALKEAQSPKRKSIKLNENRFSPNSYSSLQSAGMPGNEETDPPPIVSRTRRSSI